MIGDYAFANTRNFNGVIKWEEGTQTIGTFAFYKCTNLKLLDQSALPASVTKLGVYAFAECSNIQIDISKSSITEIPDYLFYNCDNLHNLTRQSAYRQHSGGGDSHREQYLQRLPESEHGRAAGHVENDR